MKTRIEALRSIEETRAELVREREDAIKREKRLTAEIQGLDAAAAVYRRLEAITDGVTAQEVAACASHDEGIRLIANRNGGVLLTRQAIPIFTEAGRAGNAASAKTMIHRAIQDRRDDWEKIKEGEYRLMAETPKVTQGSGGGNDATPAE